MFRRGDLTEAPFGGRTPSQSGVRRPVSRCLGLPLTSRAGTTPSPRAVNPLTRSFVARSEGFEPPTF